jgi:hypothetical protein
MIKAYKKYRSATGVEYNFYVSVAGKSRFVSLDSPGATLIVRDMLLAKAIEESNTFKTGKIYIESTVGDIPQEDMPETVETKEYPDVKTVGDAQDVLIRDFGVAEADIPLKKDVFAKADELGVSFPNYRR